ncbi:hypothetical protein [Flavobacterium lindanitolerans]|uniref:hypothetical protein n=1 Tax=Flavobacterium lindanitolerans TaxID=428988 RepID=UPI002808AF39|nr:hypothetical protein [Flavobacterium lindanitolerans]MDQ7959854.1 hypothetical protein [Flavobacterium lindanitolerans]
MDYEKPIFNLSAQEKELLAKQAQYIYGDEFRDREFLKNPVYLPRYAHLSRKILTHYAGEHYNPHTFDLTHEIFIRQLIHSAVETKVLYKLSGYDWELIDNFLKKVIGEMLKINIPYDKERIEKGMLPQYRIFEPPHSETIN